MTQSLKLIKLIILYYFNTFDGATDDIEEHAHPYAAEGEPLDGEEDCEACVI